MLQEFPAAEVLVFVRGVDVATVATTGTRSVVVWANGAAWFEKPTLHGAISALEAAGYEIRPEEGRGVW